MSASAIDYPLLLREALRGLLRRVLEQMSEVGPTGEGHLLLTFRTDHEGTELSADLRRRFPDRMTIELQYQFWELETDDGGFSVVLAFGGKKNRLHVPWDAVLGFVDPEASFGLSFESQEEDPIEPELERASEHDAEVIPFDRFRRKEE